MTYNTRDAFHVFNKIDLANANIVHRLHSDLANKLALPRCGGGCMRNALTIL